MRGDARQRFLQSAFFLIFALLALPAGAQEKGSFRIPSTLLGPTGLLFTQSTDVLDPGRVEIGFSFVNEKSSAPDFTLNEIAATATFGLPGRLEVAAHAPYLVDLESSGSHDTAWKNVDLSLKWRFLDQDPLPSFGLSLSYFLPAADKNDLGLVKNWGVRLLLLSSAEIDLAYPVASYIIGVYLDTGIFLRDLGQTGTEKHGIIDTGLLFPLNESRNVHLLIEANGTVRDDISLESNFAAATIGLRYVAAHLNATGGYQHRFKWDTGVQDTDRFILQVSLFF
jgi:hypothetical protein